MGGQDLSSRGNHWANQLQRQVQGRFLECHDFQENVTQTTNGYNYLSIGNDIYLYTGVTSANADESNLGFILENMRTGEITKYSLASATEESARESAEGAVQRNPTKQPSQSSSTSMTSLSTSWA